MKRMLVVLCCLVALGCTTTETIVISSEPEDSQIYINNRYYQKGGVKVDRNSFKGQHSFLLKIEHDNYQTIEKRVTRTDCRNTILAVAVGSMFTATCWLVSYYYLPEEMDFDGKNSILDVAGGIGFILTCSIPIAFDVFNVNEFKREYHIDLRRK
jgi:hypothetical protein